MRTLGFRLIAARVRRAAAVAGAAIVLTAAGTAGAACVGDCNGNGTVAINELVIGVSIALGIQPVSACPAFEDQSGMVTISQLVKAVNNGLGSCPVESTPTVTTGTETPTPTPTTPPPTGSPKPAVCGDGEIEVGETCDDGNTMDGDNCPSTCVINSCLFSATQLNADVIIQPPADVVIGALQVFVRYPDGVVGLPSSGSQASVAISNLPDDAFSTAVNDLDYAVRVVSVGPDGLTLGSDPLNRFFTAQFTFCQGATAPVASDFHCTVENATSVDNQDITTQTTCSVSLP